MRSLTKQSGKQRGNCDHGIHIRCVMCCFGLAGNLESGRQSLMPSIIEEFAHQIDRNARYKALKALKQPHVSKFSTSKIVEVAMKSNGEVLSEGVDIYCISIGV